MATGKLRDRIALVTGAWQGLGRVFADAFAREGADLYLMARSLPELRKTAAEIASRHGVRCFPHFIDILDERSVEDAANFVRETTGRLDILVNNAAVGRGSVPLQEVTLDEWNGTLATNLTGTFLCMKHFGRIMISQRGGKIINLTSLAARAVLRGACTGAYDCSKAAIGCLTRCMAAEWAAYDIRVNSISPGFFLTDVNRRFLKENPSFHEESRANLPLGRWGDPGEIGPLAVFLASGDSDYVTGADFDIDGGYALW